MFSLEDKTLLKSKLILPLQVSSLPVEFILIAISRNAAKLQIPICSRGVICKISKFANSHRYRYKKGFGMGVFSTGVIYNHQKRTWDSEHIRAAMRRSIHTNKYVIMQVIIKVGREVANNLF